MSQRADALAATAKIILFLDNRAAEACAVATVGVLKLDRPFSNTVPGEAEFTIDLPHLFETVLDEFETLFQDCIEGLTQENLKLHIEVNRIWQSPAVQMGARGVHQ